MGKKNWTESEDGILRENYQSKSWEELAILLPGRTYEMIRWRANKFLRMKRKNPATPKVATPKPKVATPKNFRFRPGEKRIILEFGATYPLLDLMLLLPHRNTTQIKQMAEHLGIELSGV